MSLAAFLSSAALVPDHRPWPRFELDRRYWLVLIERLDGEEWTVPAVWAEPGLVHALLSDERTGEYAVVSLPCPAGSFPALGAIRPGAIRMERAIADLIGLAPEGLQDTRPWLDHGRWPLRHPLSAEPILRSLSELAQVTQAAGDSAPETVEYSFLRVDGEGVHQIPVGPVHAGIIEPGHFRFHANGETIVRLEARLGYAHKGIEKLMAGKTVADAAPLAARISGDSTVAHSLAFARAVEAATDTPAPPRAAWVRAVMAEMERVANHLGDIGALCNDAAFSFMHAQCGVLRETVLRAAEAAFGHRLMMDKIVPGGVTVDLSQPGGKALQKLSRQIGPRFQRLMAIYGRKPSLLDRMVGTGFVDPALVRRFAAGGFVGRAAGRGFDARRSPGYAPYDTLDFEIPALIKSDVDARLKIRAREIAISLGLIDRLLTGLPNGPVLSPIPARSGEGIAMVESFRGEIVTWVRLDESGNVLRCHPRDPSWLQWPLLEAAVEGNIVADFPLCNKSFNCSYSGQDL